MIETRRPAIHNRNVYKEIAFDFSDHRHMLREAISNSIDAEAKHVAIIVEYDQNQKLNVEIRDDGSGMNNKTIDYFFSLGFSDKRKSKKASIGSKGHGAKTFLKSKGVCVKTSDGKNTIKAEMRDPIGALNNEEIPDYTVEIEKNKREPKGTLITVKNLDEVNIEDFEFDKLKLWLRWYSAAGRTNHIWNPNEKPVKFSLMVKGIPKPAKCEWKHITTTPDKWDNKFWWRHNVREKLSGRAEDQYCYYPPLLCSKILNGKKIEFKLAIVKMGVSEMKNIMLGCSSAWKGFARSEWMGFYLSKDGIIIDKLGQKEFGIKYQEMTKWFCVADCDFLDLTANRQDFRRTLEYNMVKNSMKKLVMNLPRNMAPLEILAMDGVEAEYVYEYYEPGEEKTGSEEKQHAKALKKRLGTFETIEVEEESGNISTTKIRKKKRRALDDNIRGAAKSIEEATNIQKSEDNKNKALLELDVLKEKLYKFIVSDKNEVIPVPEDSTDCAVLFSFLASKQGDYTLAKLKTSQKKTGFAVGLIVEKTEREKLDDLKIHSATFIANLSSLAVNKGFQSINTKYLICWEKGDFEMGDTISVEHQDKKRRRLHIEVGT